MKTVVSALILLLGVACRVSAGDAEKAAEGTVKETKAQETYQESVPQSGGGWLTVNEKIHVDPESQLAVVFAGEERRTIRAWLVNLAEKKAVKLCDLPQDVIVHHESHVALPKYAALSADRKTLYLDKETREDASNLPNGRRELYRDMRTNQQKIFALQRNIYAVPLNGDKAFTLTRGGDFDEWAYNPGADRVIAVACENGQTGVVVIKPDGKREFQVGVRPNKPSGTLIFGGQKMPHGGNTERSPCMMGDRFFTALGSGLYCYVRGSAKVENITPPFKPQKCVNFIAASPSSKELFMGVTEGNDYQLYSWTPASSDAPKPIGKPFFNRMRGSSHTLCVSLDQSALWAITGTIQNNVISLTERIDHIDLKTGHAKTVWTSAQIEEMVKKAELEKK